MDVAVREAEILERTAQPLEVKLGWVQYGDLDAFFAHQQDPAATVPGGLRVGQSS